MSDGRGPVTISGAAVTIMAAERLLEATRSGVPCAPVRSLIGRQNADAAYAVQQRLTASRLAGGNAIVGRKIGLTSAAVQRQLGVSQPDFGFLFDDMGFDSGAVLPMHRLLQPKVEAEIAFILEADLADGPLDDVQTRDAVAYAVAALEIVDSRIASWDISWADTVADNASAGLYVLGTEQRGLDEIEPVAVEMSLSVDREVVSTGTGADCLGDPLKALTWLARTAREHGEPLLAGQVILSGALGPVAPVRAGSVVAASLSGLGVVTASFSTVEGQAHG